MAYQKKVTQSKFDAVKTLLKGGATVREIMRYMEISDATVYMIKAAETLAEYESMIAEKSLKQQAAMHAKAQPVVTDDKQPVGTMSANYQMNRLCELVKKQVELLELLNNKVAFVVDELTK